MSIAGIEKIRQAEDSAAAIRKSAEDEAGAIAEAAKKESRDILEEARRQADEDYKAAMDRAGSQADEFYESRISSEKDACAEIRKAAGKRLEEAADLIVGKVVGTYGNS